MKASCYYTSEYYYYYYYKHHNKTILFTVAKKRGEGVKKVMDRKSIEQIVIVTSKQRISDS